MPGGAKCGVFFVAEACVAEMPGPEDAKLRSASGYYETEETVNAFGVFGAGGGVRFCVVSSGGWRSIPAGASRSIG